MTVSATPCIHGFLTGQCVSCRTCEHGQTTSACPKCRATAGARAKVAEPTGDRSTLTHRGYEIFYEPVVTGWRYRGPDSVTSPLSYRSAFLARKAVDAREDGTAEPEPAARSVGRRKGSKG